MVMKINSPDIIHKSDVGGVRVNLSTPEEVRDAYDLMMLRVGRRARRNGIRGFTAEVLLENRPMQKVFNTSGCKVQSRTSGDVVLYILDFE